VIDLLRNHYESFGVLDVVGCISACLLGVVLFIFSVILSRKNREIFEMRCECERLHPTKFNNLVEENILLKNILSGDEGDVDDEE